MAMSHLSTAHYYTSGRQLKEWRSMSLIASNLSLHSLALKSSSRQSSKDISNAELRDRVIILVSGTYFETFEETLARFPDTVLGCRELRMKYFDQRRNCLIFNRDRQAFHAILFYYQSFGILSCPSDVKLESFLEEASFFGIDASHLVVEENERLPKREASHPAVTWQESMWFLLEYPNYSRPARTVSIFWMASIVYGIFVYCFETEKQLHQWLARCLPIQSSLNQAIHPSGTVSNIWTLLELVAVVLFSFDFFLRFFFCPRKSEYLCSPYGVIDVLSIVPSYLWVTLCLLDPVYSPLGLRKVVCFLRCLRVLKLVRYSYGVQYVTWVLSQTMRDIPCFNLDMFVCLIFFATLLFNAEHRENPHNGFDSIPEAIWYVIISMTTVGYGDIVSVTLEGKLTSAACVLIGLLVLVSLPTPFFFQKFGNIYGSLEKREAKKSVTPSETSTSI